MYRTDIKAYQKATPLVRTPEGYIKGSALVTRTGVFVYQNEDGTDRRELRHPDDVFKADSLETLKMIPITVLHPSTPVGISNTKFLQVGHTGETVVTRDDGWISVSMNITNKDGVTAVEEGVRQLSLGYHLDLEEESGTYNGEPYTHRQRNIRYNHLAIVPSARAGAMASIHLDSAEIVQEEPSNMQKITLNGIQYDAAPEVANELTKLRSDSLEASNAAAATATKMTKLEAERDEHKARADKAEADLAEARSDAAIDARIKARGALIETATKLAPSVNTDGMTDSQIRAAVLKARNASINLDGKSDEYIEARFDAAAESTSGGLASPTYSGAAPVREDAAADAAYLKSKDRHNAWRNAK